MNHSSFTVIGISDAPHPWFPPDITDEINAARVFSGGRRHHEIMRDKLPEQARWIDITVPLDAVFDQYREVFDQGEPSIVVFASGDPLFFGFANTIRRKMPHADIRIHPAFNSLQTLAHRLVMPYHDMRIVSLTGRPWHEFDRAIIEQTDKMGVLTDRENTPAAIARHLLDYGFDDYDMVVGEHLGNPSCEKVTRMTLEEAALYEASHPNNLILKRKTGARNRRRFGIPDHEFALLDSRERMITKMPIRLLSLQALELQRRSVMWDVGFCTGSVSIEAKLQFPHLNIVSFEIRNEGAELMETNSRRFHAPGIRAVIGDFLATDVSTFPIPDAAFIGGHGGKLIDIIGKLTAIMPSGGIIVMNAVSLQSRELFEEAVAKYGLTAHNPIHIVLDNYNPIDILKATIP
ncbi:MAG: precorrin-6y C5,15-methyltransferase (decarboxylating) subunit CbiE [Prevotella sp.]|nr:precorrin-6y C5,15-methyltransferase (decarboxylating) subunit CbiE [Prevotella sp.]